MSLEQMEGIIEAVLFTMGDSVEAGKLADAIEQDVDTTVKIVHNLMDKYQDEGRGIHIIEYESENRGIRIIELENSFQLCTKQEYYDALIRVCSQPRRYTLTDAALETLSIIAYKQPVTKIEIENIRGVNSDRAVSKLVELGLVKEVGRLDAPGRPMLFGTTEDFLRSFGVQSIDELPTISEDMVEQYKEEAELELASESFDADNQEDSDGQITLGI